MKKRKDIMDENMKNSEEITQEPVPETAETPEAVEETAETVEVAEEIVEAEKPARGKRFRNALIAACALVAAAAILLAITGFGFVSLLKGAAEVTDIQGLDKGSFVKYENFAILGMYGEEISSDGETTGLYALVPMGGKLVTIHYPQRYVESANTIYNETTQYINGALGALDHYVIVQGTVGLLSAEAEAMMYDWFGENKDMLTSLSVIGETDDYAEYLTEEVLLVDTVNGMDQTLVIVLSAIAGALLLAAIILFLLLAFGAFHDKPAVEEVEAEVEVKVETETETVAKTETVAEEPAVEEKVENAEEDPRW